MDIPRNPGTIACGKLFPHYPSAILGDWSITFFAPYIPITIFPSASGLTMRPMIPNKAVANVLKRLFKHYPSFVLGDDTELRMMFYKGLNIPLEYLGFESFNVPKKYLGGT